MISHTGPSYPQSAPYPQQAGYPMNTGNYPTFKYPTTDEILVSINFLNLIKTEKIFFFRWVPF